MSDLPDTAIREYFIQHLEEYRKYYHLPDSAHHELKRVSVNDTSIVMQKFIPENCKETVLFLHGYLDHSGAQAAFFKHLLDRQIGIVAVDFPGHGLSDGKRHFIEQFEQYEEVLVFVLNEMKKLGVERPTVIGHSTGAGVAAHYVLKEKKTDIKKLILAAPLARINGWAGAKLSHFIVAPLIDEVPRKYRKNSGDRSFMQKQKNDVLQTDRIPLAWVSAMVEWEKQIQLLEENEIDTTVLQGTEDGTVDWKYNVKFFNEKFKNNKTILIDKGEHQLFNETEAVKEIVYHLIDRALKE